VLSLVEQCALAGLARSTYYYDPVVASEENLKLMRAIDELYMKRPFYGSQRMTDWLGELGWIVNEKRVARLMRVMGLQAIVPGPHTSRAHPEHRVYPYLLRDLEIQRPNQVWCSDITYVPMRRGFLYLVVVMDWYSRYVLAWELSNTLEVLFCVEALQQALGIGHPEIFNTDQGAQFTSAEFIRETTGGWDTDQHGRTGTGAGQRNGGAVVAQCEPPSLTRSKPVPAFFCSTLDAVSGCCRTGKTNSAAAKPPCRRHSPTDSGEKISSIDGLGSPDLTYSLPSGPRAIVGKSDFPQSD
jgi:hypothetical protein